MIIIIVDKLDNHLSSQWQSLDWRSLYHLLDIVAIDMKYVSSQQSVTSRLETSRYRDFSQFFESIGLGLENFGLEKKSRYRSRKYLVSKNSLGIGLENI